MNNNYNFPKSEQKYTLQVPDSLFIILYYISNYHILTITKVGNQRKTLEINQRLLSKTVSFISMLGVCVGNIFSVISAQKTYS